MEFSGFKSLVDGIGMAAGNRYSVQITGGGGVSFDESDNAMCCSVDVAAAQFDTFDWSNLSATVKLPFAVLYEPLSMSFYTADDGVTFGKFLTWQQKIWDQGAWRFNDFESYASGSSVIVQEYNKQGGIISIQAYYNLYPTIVGPKTLTYENRNMVNKFNVSLFYESMQNLL